MEKGRGAIPHDKKGKHSQRKINDFFHYSPGGMTCFHCFLLHNRLVHLMRVSGSSEDRGKNAAGKDRDRDRRGQTEPDRDKASECHAQKKVLGRQTAGARPWQGAEARRLQTRPGGCSLTDGALWLRIAWEGGICLINEKQSADLAF